MSLFGPVWPPLCLPPVGKLLTVPNIPVTLPLFYNQLLYGEVAPTSVSVLT
jgi:hypothetical protein